MLHLHGQYTIEKKFLSRNVEKLKSNKRQIKFHY